MTTAREDANRLADLLRREHHALADFLIALARFDSERRWEKLGHGTLFSFLTRDLHLSAGAAQYRKTAATLIQSYPEIESALRDGRLCLSSVIALGKVIKPENAGEVLPRFFGLSSRDAEFLAASIRPVEKLPTRDFLVTPARAAVAVTAPAPVAFDAFRAPETELIPVTGVPAGATHPPAFGDRPKIKPLDAERARINMTVSRRLLEKLAAARDALSHSHPRASEEEIIEVGLDLVILRHRKRRGIGAMPRRPAPKTAAAAPAAPVSDAPPTKRSRHVQRSGVPCGSATRAAARGLWRAAACAARRTGSSSTTSTDSRGEPMRPSPEGASSAARTSSSTLAGFTGIESWIATRAPRRSGAAPSRSARTRYPRRLGADRRDARVGEAGRVPTLLRS